MRVTDPPSPGSLQPLQDHNLCCPPRGKQHFDEHGKTDERGTVADFSEESEEETQALINWQSRSAFHCHTSYPDAEQGGAEEQIPRRGSTRGEETVDKMNKRLMKFQSQMSGAH